MQPAIAPTSQLGWANLHNPINLKKKHFRFSHIFWMLLISSMADTHRFQHRHHHQCFASARSSKPATSDEDISQNPVDGFSAGFSGIFISGKDCKLEISCITEPVAYLSHMTTGIGILAAQAFVGEITTWLGISEFNPKERTVIGFLHSLYDCYDLMSAFTGKNCCLNESTMDLFLMNEPHPTSTKNMVHLAQTVRDGVLSKFDYGSPDFNMQHYGQGKPPVYNLTNIPSSLPIFISYGGQDALADVRDGLLLLDSLKLHDGGKPEVQFVKDYAHADFIMGVNAKEIVYNAIAAFFKRQP